MTTATRRRTTRAVQPPKGTSRWQSRSACRNEDPDLHFPVGSGAAAVEQTEAAKKVCMRCPVRTECLDWAVETGQDSGVWGGLSEGERWSLRAEKVPCRKPVADTRKSPMTDRCLESQAFIAERLAMKVSQRKIAEELGVSPDSLRRAIRVLNTERTARGEALLGVAA